MIIVECKNLEKRYKHHSAVNNLSFTLEENKITGLIGRNGAGKTTLLKMIAGHYKKSGGDLKVFSEDPFASLKVSTNMIFIDDRMAFPPSLTLSEILQYAKSFYANWNDQLAKGLFDYFSFHPKTLHHKLSKGMNSTFNMIIGLAARCPLTIFDEPTTGMDAAVRQDFYRALLKDYIQHPRSIILSSHLLNEIDDMLEDVLLINNGEKILHLPVTDLKEYGIGLKGDRQAINDVIKNEDVLYYETIGVNSCYAAIKNNFTEAEIHQLRGLGIELSPVSTNELSVYLTSENKGGIDDVFRRI